jgi:hypothetical protein
MLCWTTSDARLTNVCDQFDVILNGNIYIYIYIILMLLFVGRKLVTINFGL